MKRISVETILMGNGMESKKKNFSKCETCKYWEEPENEFGEVPGTGTCKAVVQFWDATEWSADADARVLSKEFVGRLAFVQDGSDYYAALKTFPDFGCVQHEEK